MIVVLGAGLAGLSTALHLDRSRVECRVFERESQVGGLARSIDAGGFTFDFTGHLLHLSDASVKALVDELLPEKQVHLERSAWIAYRGSLVPYPFQANTALLPDAVKLECLRGFAESLLAKDRPEPGGFEPRCADLPLSFLRVKEPRGGFALSFRDWTIATFGRGFAEHFFLPYNEKNFATDLATISAEWVSWAVPKPDLEDVIRGAIGAQTKTFGYNPRFRYPLSGGIQALPSAMARRIEGKAPIERGAAVERIDATAKQVVLADGRTLRYDALVATNPLPELVGMIDDLPPEVRAAASKLRWCAVSSYNYGIEGSLDHSRHWIYYPEREFAFYRVGFPSNLAPSMAPPGSASVTAEVAYPGDPRAEGPFAPAAASDRVRADLIRCGAIPKGARITIERRLDLPYAYVLFDAARREALPVIFRALLERDIVPVGRYGAWDYLSMEQTILQGRETAEHLLRRFG